MEKKRFKKIYIEITNVCNLKCSFCTPTKRAFKFMSVSEFKEIILKVKDYTNLIALHVKGEPLMHPNLKEILAIAEDNNIMVNITTNATLLYKNKDILINSKSVRQLNLSLHSIDQNNIEKSLNDKYLEQILLAVKEITSKTNIYISYRLWNLNDLKNDNNLAILEVLKNEYNIDNLMDLAKDNKAIKLYDNIYLNQDFEFIWPSIDNNIVSEVGKCYGLRNQLAILSNGDIVPCCLDQDACILLGNIFENAIEEVINSPKSISIVEGFENNKLTQDLCKRCGYISKFNK